MRRLLGIALLAAATAIAAAPYRHYSVGNKNVKALLLEGDTLWVATSGGLLRVDTRGGGAKLYEAGSGLLSNAIFHLSRLRGRLAVGTYGGGLSLLDEKTGQWETFNVPDGLGDAFVYDVLQASNGDVWIATWSGVNRVRGGALRDRSRWELHTVESTRGGLINDWVYGLAEGKDGAIWMATEGGLVRYRAGKWENWNHARGLGAPYDVVKSAEDAGVNPSKLSEHHARQGVASAYNPDYVISLVVDRDGVVWAGTWGAGLARFDGTKWTNYTTREGMPGNHVFMLRHAKDGGLWIGTERGLAHFARGKFATLTKADGLFADAVFAMADARDGALWVGSYGGVAYIPRK